MMTMKKKLDALFGRSFKTSRFKILAGLVIARISHLEKQHKSRCSQARLDVSQLLHEGHLERALQRVEYAIREQNMLDSYAMIDNYCHLLTERLVVIQTNSGECPDELKEAIASLIFAAARCGELPELQEMKRLFTCRYGKEFTARATDMRNNCGVDPRIAKKLSTKLPSLESKIKALKEIAPKCKLIPHLDEVVSSLPKSQAASSHNNYQHQVVADDQSAAATTESSARLTRTPSRSYSESYPDFEAAAQAACELSAQAAAAARAAMELSRPPTDYDGHGSGTAAGTGDSSSDRNDISSALKLLRRSNTISTSEGFDTKGKSRVVVASSSDYVPKLFKRSSSTVTSMFNLHPPNIGR